MTTRNFPTAVVMTAYTGTLLCPIDQVYEILNHITGDSIFTHQIPRVVEEVRPHLAKQHPWLALLNVSGITPENWSAFVHGIVALRGAELAVEPMAPGEHYAIDPVSELAEKVHPSRIVTVGVNPSGPAGRALPHPGSPEASGMLDSMLAEYNYPANPKNAARAGWEAANRWLTTGTAGVNSSAKEPR